MAAPPKFFDENPKSETRNPKQTEKLKSEIQNEFV